MSKVQQMQQTNRKKEVPEGVLFFLDTQWLAQLKPSVRSHFQQKKQKLYLPGSIELQYLNIFKTCICTTHFEYYN